MAEEKCFCHLNGYAVKDATAREYIQNLSESVQIMEDKEIPEIKTKITDILSMINELHGNPLDTVSVTFNLENVVTATTVSNIPIGQDFTTIIEAVDGYQIKNILVKVGDVAVIEEDFIDVDIYDETFDAFSISLPSVTGDITITATGKEKLSNLIDGAVRITSGNLVGTALTYGVYDGNYFNPNSLPNSNPSEEFAIAGVIATHPLTIGSKFKIVNAYIPNDLDIGIIVSKNINDINQNSNNTTYFNAYSGYSREDGESGSYIYTITKDFSDYSVDGVCYVAFNLGKYYGAFTDTLQPKIYRIE